MEADLALAPVARTGAKADEVSDAAFGELQRSVHAAISAALSAEPASFLAASESLL